MRSLPLTLAQTGRSLVVLLCLTATFASCGDANPTDPMKHLSAAELLGNPDFPAISYGGYGKRAVQNNPPSTS